MPFLRRAESERAHALCDPDVQLMTSLPTPLWHLLLGEPG